MNFVTKLLLTWSLTASLLALSFYFSTRWAREEVTLLRNLLSDHSCPATSLFQTYWTKFITLASILCFTLFYFRGSMTSSDEASRLQFELKELKIKTMTKHVTNECVVCLTNPFQVVLVPCGHICLCKECLKELNSNKKCPVCRATFEQHVNIYFA